MSAKITVKTNKIMNMKIVTAIHPIILNYIKLIIVSLNVKIMKLEIVHWIV